MRTSQLVNLNFPHSTSYSRRYCGGCRFNPCGTRQQRVLVARRRSSSRSSTEGQTEPSCLAVHNTRSAAPRSAAAAGFRAATSGKRAAAAQRWTADFLQCLLSQHVGGAIGGGTMTAHAVVSLMLLLLPHLPVGAAGGAAALVLLQQLSLPAPWLRPCWW